MSRKAPKIAFCPACSAEVRFRKTPYMGQYKICADCDTELEVVNLSPIELELLDNYEAYEEDDEPFDDDYDSYNYDDDSGNRRIPA
ncbi:MAG: hypothetical protein KDE51_19600 [Anaerolineales bacterium]|nr:hypothetical protein [Anaerolineales bacterium]